MLRLVDRVEPIEYFIETDPLTEAETQVLFSVLQARLPTKTDAEPCYWVIPRWGTQSPWGTKARDILHHVGLTKIHRIERAKVSINECLPHDRMTESVVTNWEAIAELLKEGAPSALQTIPLQEKGKAALEEANQTLGLALSSEEIDYLTQAYQSLERDPTDVELMMFAQANSEHCRHKIFKATWEIDGEKKLYSLFDMIRNTHQQSPEGVLSAYKDNASVIAGKGQARFYCDPNTRLYQTHAEPVHILMKVETHNHPTAIEPFAGAGTGQGGEIRDEGATGRGAKPKAGLTGLTVSYLHIPDYVHPWEKDQQTPSRIATAFEIMQKAPIGGAAFNNEFGRPNICGYFRAFEQVGDPIRGYHKPIMIAGGMGNILEQHVEKQSFPAGSCLVVLGGPAMKIGLGGGAASSMAQGSSEEALDFASVQRQNPEMQRRCQEVIDQCWALGAKNPILSIHDVGAGGLANALPELVHDAKQGANLSLRAIPNAEPSMTPLEIWCNESQERYVLAIDKTALPLFEKIAKRERCPYAVLGESTEEQALCVTDPHFKNKPIDIPQDLLFGNAPKLVKKAKKRSRSIGTIDANKQPIDSALRHILQHPTVADKSFLITIGDRSVGGLVARDQMVGPWQVPVADCAVTATNFDGTTGEAMSMGERPGIALIDPAASARMAVAEAVQNILASDVASLSDIRLSCNWMASANHPEEEADLYAAVEAVGLGLCPEWGIAVPVGKDSLSMRTTWESAGKRLEVISPVTLVVSAFAPVQACRETLTPLLNHDLRSPIMLIDLAKNQKRLGGSIFAEITEQTGGECPDVDSPELMKHFSQALVELKQNKILLAYHDRSDGGMWASLCEMAFASRVGLEINLTAYAKTKNELAAALLNEECGVLVQVAADKIAQFNAIMTKHDLANHCYEVAKATTDQIIQIKHSETIQFSEKRSVLQALWSKTSYKMQALRDDPRCAQEAYDNIVNDTVLDLRNMKEQILAPVPIMTHRPIVAILREQGVNGQVEMAAAFTAAGFDAIDVSMSDLLAGENLEAYQGLAVCGGFSYGDVLGAGRGWAATILHQPRLKDIFEAFFQRADTFTLGVCNGCQMLSHLSGLIPGASGWPKFIRNDSKQFEARLSLVEITPSPSILLKGMEGFRLPIVVSHGEGKAHYANAVQQSDVCLRYINNQGQATLHYPENPNGSPLGITGLTTQDGRVTIMMPHPERVVKAWQLSWHPSEWQEESPWMRLFINAKLHFAY